MDSKKCRSFLALLFAAAEHGVRSLAATAYHFRTWVYYGYGRLTSEEHNLQMAYTKDLILEEFKLFSVPTGGIGRWLTKNTDEDVFNRLIGIENNPLPYVQLNQLLVLGHEAPVSEGFFKYYWLSNVSTHPYPVNTISSFYDEWLDGSSSIKSLGHLKWGLYRLFVDALLYFGNVRTAFRKLRDLSFDDIKHWFEGHRFDTEAIRRRGPALPLGVIPKDDRYLISEMACKSFGTDGFGDTHIRDILSKAYMEASASGQAVHNVKDLIAGNIPKQYHARQTEIDFSAAELIDDQVRSEQELNQKIDRLARRFQTAREAALGNTRLYLSMLGDLDVYVATSMRSRQDFRKMAETCEHIFNDERLGELSLRYFDPTLSAASGHEDKGLIECLMVKCAKLLIYCAGEKESYGKDAEAAMALSLGKPVIFYCDHAQRSRFYKEVHPLSRLIEFNTGIAVGALVSDNLEDVSELVLRTLSNTMQYELEQSKPGFLRLKEKLTGSVVRLQTNDPLLAETFWNHYHRDKVMKTKGVAEA